MISWAQFPYWPRTYLLVGVLAFLISVGGMPIMIAILRRLRMIDAVAAHKIHTKPIVRGGGIMLFIAFAVAVTVPGYRSTQFNGVLIGAFICMFVGALDDLTGGGIPGFWKLLTLVAVTFILEHYGVRMRIFKQEYLDVLGTLFWIVWVTSAFNGLDNMDGLAGGVAAIVCLVFVFIAVQAWTYVHTETSLAWFGMISAGLMGSCLGFLIYNFNPAKVFMGDSGSFFLGYTLAALGVMGEWTENRIISCMIPVLVLGVPIFDFAYVILMRIIRGETRSLRSIIDHCAPDHISHRLVWIGFSHRQAVSFIYLICFILGASGILIRNSVNYLDSVLGILQGLAILAVIVVLMNVAMHHYRQRAR